MPLSTQQIGPYANLTGLMQPDNPSVSHSSPRLQRAICSGVAVVRRLATLLTQLSSPVVVYLTALKSPAAEGEAEAVALVLRGGAMSASPLLLAWIGTCQVRRTTDEGGEGAEQGLRLQDEEEVHCAVVGVGAVVHGEIEMRRATC